MSSVSIQAVSRTFEGRKGQRTQALLPVDFEVRDNDFVTILGPSGCGKSTLLRIVAGLDHATSGRVLLDGVPVEGPGADRGMVFQSYTLFPWLTIEQNIRFGLRERGMPEAQQKERAAYFIAKVGLRGFGEGFFLGRHRLKAPGAEFAAQVQVPFLGNVLGAVQRHFAGGLAESLAANAGGGLPGAMVRAAVNLQAAIEH